MSTDLVKTSDVREFIVPPILLDKNKLSTREHVHTMREAVIAGTAAAVIAVLWSLFLLTVNVPLVGGFIGAHALTPTIVISSITFAIGALAFGLWVNAPRVNARHDQVLFERNRLQAPHADERKERAGDVNYPHYSTWVSWRGASVTLSLLEHKKVGQEWHAEFIKFGYSDVTGWDSGSIVLRKPSLSDVEKSLRTAEREARAKEENAYEEAISVLRAQRIALILRRPQSGMEDVEIEATLSPEEKELRNRYLHGEAEADELVAGVKDPRSESTNGKVKVEK